jgi:uncharacterized protein with NAD-binding domain and iron-sulfur cluster
LSGLKVIIVGGGLAGMTVAHELLKHRVEVVILEAGTRLGGKAGADLIGSRYEEHGNHFFPAWYLNTRRLLRALEIANNLVDMKRLHQLRKGCFPHFETLNIPTKLWNLPWNKRVHSVTPVRPRLGRHRRSDTCSEVHCHLRVSPVGTD